MTFIDENEICPIALDLCKNTHDQEWIKSLYSRWIEFDSQHFDMIFSQNKDVPLILIDYDLEVLGKVHVPGGQFSFPKDKMEFTGTTHVLSDKYNVSVIRINGNRFPTERSKFYAPILLHEMLHLWVDYQWRDSSRIVDQNESIKYWREATSNGAQIDLEQDGIFIKKANEIMKNLGCDYQFDRSTIRDFPIPPH